jgi:hypothetical protein
MLRVPGRIEHLSTRDYDLTPAQAVYLILCWFGTEFGLAPEALGLTHDDIAAAAARQG